MNYLLFPYLPILFNLILSLFYDPVILPDSEGRIALNPSMVLNEQAIGYPEAIVDEQNLSVNSSPKSVWKFGWINEKHFPLSAVIDLGKEFHINKVLIYDGKGKGKITINSGKPFQWVKDFSYDQSAYNEWISHDLDKKTRYLQVVVESKVSPYEILLYGYPIEKEKATVTGSENKINRKSPTTMDKMIGINAFIDDPIDKIKVASFVREYHNWRWDAANIKFPHNLNAWSPSKAGNKWDFDQFYSTLSNLGIEVIPCLQGNPKWIPGNSEDKPILFNKSSKDPAAYIAHADYLYQYVARYGNNKLPSKNLKLETNQPFKSGMNLLSYIENWNEQNKTWLGMAAYFTPYEYAAMSSADYDGHIGAIKGNVGIKKADPEFKMVMGGLAGLNLDYIRSIKFWADFKRNGEVPFDVINLHHYSRKGDNENAIGISPEEDSLKQKLEKIVAYRNEFMPNKEIWITEFGYDTHPDSPQRAPRIKNMSNEEVQAQWLVRSYLEIAAAGVDRAAMYMLRDADSQSATKYATCGLTSSKESGWKPKTSWYYIYTLKNTLKGMRFSRAMRLKNINIYKFEDVTKDKVGFVVWSPTSEAKVINNFKLNIGNNAKKATKITLQKGEINGVSEPIEISNNTVTLQVTETPKFIIIDTDNKK